MPRFLGLLARAAMTMTIYKIFENVFYERSEPQAQTLA
jgi:hypothetical protein